MLSIYKRGKLEIKKKEKKNSFFLSISGRLLLGGEGRGGENFKISSFFSLEID
jgi:hypothetical protein